MGELKQLEGLTRQLLGEAKATVGLLEQGEAQAWEDSWNRRRRLFKRVMAGYQKLGPDLARWREEGAAHADPEKAREAERVARAVRRVSRQVLEVDRRAAELLARERDAAAKEVDRLKSGRRVRQVYGNRPRDWWGPDRISRTG